MVTIVQVREYLSSIGITIPDFMIEIMISQLSEVSPCIEANYGTGTATLIYLYLIGLMSSVQGDKYISSQTAPSGASQSFRYRSMQDAYRGQLALLRNLDKHGCTNSLVPTDPSAVSGGIWVGKGGCL